MLILIACERGVGAKITPPPRHCAARIEPWRARPVPFCLHGLRPPPRSYSFKLNKKVKQLAYKNVLSYKVNENLLTVVDKIGFETIKTTNFVAVLNNIKVEGKTLVVCTKDELTKELFYSARNVANTILLVAENVSVYDILCYKNLVLTEAAVKYYEEGLN